MAYFRQRRSQEPYQPAFRRSNAESYAVDEDGDRIYTEDDYAEPASEAEWYPDEDAFAPDGADDAGAAFDPFNIPGGSFRYTEAFDDEDDETGEFPPDGDPLADELLTDAERAALRRNHWRLLAGLADFIGVIAGTAAILVLIALLVSLLNWLMADINQTFTMWQTRI
ncbi:MAG: hypothetical protein IJZ74_05250 [Clostridia bacterium]|nr:hypothetical protein [Clostridia bacterium]